jgi:hypothetical protein
MENGLESLWNSNLMSIHTGQSNSRNNHTHHFIYVEKRKNKRKFYMYQGKSFQDIDGYKLIMMAIYSFQEDEIRIYSNNDLEEGREGLISSLYKFKSGMSNRASKVSVVDFDLNSHFAKVCI